MEKVNPPITLGVLKPVGHTVMAFRSDLEMQAAAKALVDRGFASSTMVRYTPDEMKALVDAELRAASPIASFGYELDLVNAHGALAESGCSFLIVHAPEKKQADIAATVARTMKAVAAQHYGTFMIEDLIDQAAGDAPASR